MGFAVKNDDITAGEGEKISTTTNTVQALTRAIGYTGSRDSIQAALARMQAAISELSTQIVEQFQKKQNSKGGALYEMQKLKPNPKDPNDNYSTEISKLTSRFGSEQAANQQLTKVMDANNSIAQNALNQNAQGQQGDMTLMQSILAVAGNLVSLLRG